MPKYFDLCLDEVAIVREQAAKQATASIIRNLASSQDEIEYAASRMKYFFESPSCTHRQVFVWMIESIIFDEVTSGKCSTSKKGGLIQTMVCSLFKNEMLSLSKDLISNIRVSLAEIFMKLHQTFEQHPEYQDRLLEIMNYPLIVEVLQTLKQDKCELVLEYLAWITVKSTRASSLEDDEAISQKEN